MVTENLDEKQDMLYDTSLRLEQAEKKVSEAERHLSSTKMEIAGAEEDLIQIKTESRETKQKLMAEQEEIKQENLLLKLDMLTLHSDKEHLLCDVQKAENEKEQILARKDGLLEDIDVLDKEFEKRLDFINVLDKLKAILYKLLSMIPIVREFARLVEEKRDIRAASPYGYPPLGRLLKEYRTPLPQYDRLVIFPEIASWQTSKGEVIPVYEDFNRRGTSYTLAGFWNMQTDSGIKTSEIKDEITPGNRICTLEQAEVYVKAVESFMEEMKPAENTKHDHSVHRSYSGEYERDR